MKKHVVGIKSPPKPWWPGDMRVEKYMENIDKTLIRYNLSKDASVDIYNRAYEAIHQAIKDYSIRTE